MDLELLKKEDLSLGVLICGHGSRSDSAAREFARLAEAIKSRLSGIPCEYGYLEFASPNIRTSLEKLHSKSVKKILALPAMLFAAGHAKNDIPSVLNTYSAETGIEIKYGRELGVDRLMIAAAGERLKETISSYPAVPFSDTLLLVVGRGSSDPDANSNVSKITRMLVEGLGFGWGETVYSGVTFPLVEPGLRHVVRLGFKRIIVFPYFLFSGVLLTRIKEHTAKVATDYPKIEFLFASYLGDHPFVVDTFLERIQETFEGDTAMNCSLCKYRASILGFEKEVGLVQEGHHHHVEAKDGKEDVNHKQIISRASSKNFNEEDIESVRDLEEQQQHQHHHHPYPQADHPLGPVTLKNQSTHKPKEI